MPELKSWGIVWAEAIPHSAGWRCENPTCSWRVPFGTKAFEHIVGFAHEPAFKDLKRMIIGKAIFKCPVCFEKIWVHFDEIIVKEAIEFCPSWPK